MARIIRLTKDKLASGPKENGRSIQGRVEKLERHIPIYSRIATLAARSSALEAELAEVHKERDRLLLLLEKVAKHEATVLAAAGVGMVLCLMGATDPS